MPFTSCANIVLSNGGGTHAILVFTSSLHHRNFGRQHGAVSFGDIGAISFMWFHRIHTPRIDDGSRNHRDAVSGRALSETVVRIEYSMVCCLAV